MVCDLRINIAIFSKVTIRQHKSIRMNFTSRFVLLRLVRIRYQWLQFAHYPGERRHSCFRRNGSCYSIYEGCSIDTYGRLPPEIEFKIPNPCKIPNVKISIVGNDMKLTEITAIGRINWDHRHFGARVDSSALS